MQHGPGGGDARPTIIRVHNLKGWIRGPIEQVNRRPGDQPNKYLLNMAYYVPDSYGDDYLQVAKGATDLFRAEFPIDENLEQVQITAVQRYKDDYGNENTTILARTLMSRDTYGKVNWDAFEYQKLAKITPMDFYGKSIYKSLLDLQASLDNWRAITATTKTSTAATTAAACATAQEQCNQGSCDTIHLLTTAGMC